MRDTAGMRGSEGPCCTSAMPCITCPSAKLSDASSIPESGECDWGGVSSMHFDRQVEGREDGTSIILSLESKSSGQLEAARAALITELPEGTILGEKRNSATL